MFIPSCRLLQGITLLENTYHINEGVSLCLLRPKWMMSSICGNHIVSTGIMLSKFYQNKLCHWVGQMWNDPKIMKAYYYSVCRKQAVFNHTWIKISTQRKCIQLCIFKHIGQNDKWKYHSSQGSATINGWLPTNHISYHPVVLLCCTNSVYANRVIYMNIWERTVTISFSFSDGNANSTEEHTDIFLSFTIYVERKVLRRFFFVHDI